MIQHSKYPSWSSFLLKQANNVKRRQKLKASWLLFIVVFLHIWLLQFFSLICVFHPFVFLDFPLFSNSTSLIIAIFLPLLIFNMFSILFSFPFCLCCHRLLTLPSSNWALHMVLYFLTNHFNNIPTILGERSTIWSIKHPEPSESMLKQGINPSPLPISKTTLRNSLGQLERMWQRWKMIVWKALGYIKFCFFITLDLPINSGSHAFLIYFLGLC